MAITLAPLPAYPSTKTRESLTPSQSATLLQTISNALVQALSLSDSQLSNISPGTFIASYVKDVAQQSLHALVWSTANPSMSPTEREIRHSVFLLSERLASLGKFDVQTLVDFSVAYSQVSPGRLRALFLAAFVQAPASSALVENVEKSAVPAFTALLSSQEQGLYGLRKTAHILLSLLRPAPPPVTRAFARNEAFVRALATAYHAGLAALAESYGGLRALAAPGSSTGTGAPREPDEWERLFLDTKVALLDAFQVLMRTLLDDVASVPAAGPALAANAEPAFAVVFALIELQTPALPDTLAPTPFLNRSLLADYQHAYDLSRTLKDTLRRTEDARADVLEAALRAMTDGAQSGPGALRLVLRSSGVPPGIDGRGRGSAGKGDVKGKGRAKDVGQRVDRSSPSGRAVPDEQLDVAVAQVLDLFPDQDPGYLRYVLGHGDYPYKGDAEKMIAALLDGTAPSPEDVQAAVEGDDVAVRDTNAHEEAEFTFTRERRNVFDDDVMDLSRIRFGKGRCAWAF